MIWLAVATTVRDLGAGDRADVVDREHVRRVGHRDDEPAVLPADRDRLVAAGERLADERRDRRRRSARSSRSTNSSPTWRARVRTSSASEIVPCSISSRPSGLPLARLLGQRRVELGLGEQALVDEQRAERRAVATPAASSAVRSAPSVARTRPCVDSSSGIVDARGGTAEWRYHPESRIEPARGSDPVCGSPTQRSPASGSRRPENRRRRALVGAVAGSRLRSRARRAPGTPALTATWAEQPFWLARAGIGSAGAGRPRRAPLDRSRARRSGSGSASGRAGLGGRAPRPASGSTRSPARRVAAPRARARGRIDHADRARLDELAQDVADVDHGPRPVRCTSSRDRAPAVDRDEQRPALAVDDDLVDLELVEQAGAALERRDDAAGSRATA